MKRLFTDEEGRKVLDLKDFNLPMKTPVLVLTRNDGTSLYGLRDIAYAIDKSKLGKSRSIVIIGEEQKLYQQQVNSALTLLKIKPIEAVHYSLVTVPGGGKMGTRTGNALLLDDFMNESIKKAKSEIKSRKSPMTDKLVKTIAFGAIKYTMLKVSPDKNLVFDWEQAMSFDGEAAPYIQYAHARSCSILRKGKKYKFDHPDYALAITPEEVAIVNKLYQFPEVVKKATEDLRPHLIAVYAYQLAKTFKRILSWVSSY